LQVKLIYFSAFQLIAGVRYMIRIRKPPPDRSPSEARKGKRFGGGGFMEDPRRVALY
jgi:hypothetical protein